MIKLSQPSVALPAGGVCVHGNHDAPHGGRVSADGEYGVDEQPFRKMRSQKKPVAGEHGLKRILNLIRRDGREKGSDCRRVFSGRDDVSCGKMGQGIQTVMDHQHPVEFGLQLHMRDSRAFHLRLHVRVACGIQREVAEKTV